MSPTGEAPLAKLGLGTVQWGLSYGVSNQSGRTSLAEVRRIMDAARQRGVNMLDTAALYGEAEATLGEAGVADFAVVTKSVKFDGQVAGKAQAEALHAGFRRSLDRLRLDRVHGLLFHEANDVLAAGGEHLVEAMRQLKQQGLVAQIGVSVYDAAQIDRMLARFVPDVVQLPINVLDQRLLASGHLTVLKAEGVEIHARSAFLQGLLLMPQDVIPAYFRPIEPVLGLWQARLAQTGMSATQAALAFVRDLPEIDKVIVGVESLSQFKTIAQDMAGSHRFDATGLACDQEEFVNPARWVLSR